MPAYYTGNRWLTSAEMHTNAEYIFNNFVTYFPDVPYTLNALSGMLGNFQTESQINPGVWENFVTTNPNLGYGLVQWTPSTNYTDWCDQLGIPWDHMESALRRIRFEYDTHIQYYQTADYPISFYEFLTSTQTPEYLAIAWQRNYERGQDAFPVQRQQRARYWFEYFGGWTPTPTPSGRTKMPVWMMLRKPF